MKAVQFKSFGGPEVIEIVEIEELTPDTGQVLVEIRAASLNRFDTYIRTGGFRKDIELPKTLGGDFAGVVRSVGIGVTDYKAGDEVYGTAGFVSGGSGSLAEFALAKAENIAIKPSIDFLKSAALPLVASSALQGIEEELEVSAGQKVLIQGGAGGIGSLAIQLAKMLGAYVATTVGPDDVEFAKSLGADQVINYESQNAAEILKDFDGVFNTANPAAANKLFPILKRGGKFVSMTGPADQTLAKQYEIETIAQATKTNTEHLDKIRELVDKGRLKVFVDKVFPFEQTRQAYEYFETKHPRGKVVVEIKKD